jgi:adenosylcobinamide amidohydrolase
MNLPFALTSDPPFLIVEFELAQRSLGWSPTAPGFVEARRIAWLEVCNADLTPEVDPIAVLREKFSARGLGDALAFMTSRDIRRFHVAQSTVGEATVTSVATVGLSNGEHVGKRARHGGSVGTINVFAHVSKPLSVSAFVEAISIVAEARTAAIIATAGLRAGPLVTGTGTDCIVVAAPQGERLQPYAGLHTEIGQALGAAVYEVIREGATQWSADVALGLKPSHPRDRVIGDDSGRHEKASNNE